MPAALTLEPLPLRPVPGGQLRACRVVTARAGGAERRDELRFLYPPGLPLPAADDADAYVLAALLPAMRLGGALRVEGQVSRGLLANLVELQHVWRRWRPSQYHALDVEATAVADAAPRAGAVVAFSGGVDGQFTALRHARHRAGPATRDVRAGVFVHGFDIPLGDEAGFRRAACGAATALADLGLEAWPVRTNLREVFDADWEDHHGTALAAVLTGLKAAVGTGLIGSSTPYDEDQSRWGSGPIPDALCSSGAFRVVHDGAGYGRTEKVRALAAWPVGVRHLRVCWEGGAHDRNCGRCEKCVRTRVHFALGGVPGPPCFPGPLAPDALAALVLAGPEQRGWWGHVRAEAARTEEGRVWLPAIDALLARRPRGRALGRARARAARARLR